MRIAPEIVAKHWEAAAAEQLARDLERQGYEVSLREPIGGHVADVVARRGGEVTVYEVKAPPWDERQADELVGLRDEAVDGLRARFKLVIVTPPHEVAAEVAGLDNILLGCLGDPTHEDLDAMSSRTQVDAVSDVEIASIMVKPPTIHVEGDGIVHVTLGWGREDDAAVDRESFPFSFALDVGPDGRLLGVDRLEVDTSAWYGSGDEDDDLEPEEPPRADSAADPHSDF